MCKEKQMRNVFVLMLSLTACGPQKEVVEVINGKDGQDGTSCSVADYFGDSFNLLGAKISCTDGSYSIVLNGLNGAQGIAGQNGQSCSVSRAANSSYATVSCPNQQPVKIYDGVNGTNGTNGTSCSVAQTLGGAQVTCGNSMAMIYNGASGTNGINGTNGTSCSVSKSNGVATITCGSSTATVLDGTNSPLANALGIAAILKPCGDEFPNDEVFIKLTDGRVLAVYDGGPNEDRLAILVVGMTYRTTDRGNNNKTCTFQVNSAGNLINESMN